MSCDEEDKRQRSMAQVISGAVCGILMLVSIVVYLVLGLTLNFWHPGWVIIVGSGVLCGIIEIISDTVDNVKKIKETKENDKKEL